jgi:hypothetical protein
MSFSSCHEGGEENDKWGIREHVRERGRERERERRRERET